MDSTQHSAEPPTTAPPKRRRRWLRLLRRAAISLVVLCLIGAIVFGIVAKDHIRSLWSLRRVPNTNMYVMDYYGSYNAAGLREHGVDPEDVPGSLIRNFLPRFLVPIGDALSGHEEGVRSWREPGHSCSTVSFRTEKGEVYVGRNLDWTHDPCLIVRMHANDVPTSVAVLDPYYLQLDQAKLEDLSLTNRLRLLFAPYLAMDGMNEAGVAVSSMAASESIATFDPEKPTLVKPMMTRVILDYARSTDDAVALLQIYNVDFDGLPCHFMIADASGKSVVVEFVEGRIEIVSSPERWQVSTNHLLFGKTESESDERCARYRRASDRLAQLGPEIDAAQVMDVMASLSVPDWTMWTSVYNLTTGEYQVAYRRQYDAPYQGQLDMR